LDIQKKKTNKEEAKTKLTIKAETKEQAAECSSERYK
jgi:hypothetical protein